MPSESDAKRSTLNAGFESMEHSDGGMTESDILFSALSFVSLGFGVSEFLVHRRESRTLLQILRFRFGPEWNQRIESLEQVREIKRLLNERISHEGVSKMRKRPILRESATEILAMGKGYCGENARTAIRLLSIGGLKTNRIYVENSEWGHVLCEFVWNGKRKMFDGHIDPVTKIPDEVIGAIDSEDISAYPNDLRDDHPWLKYYRIKQFHRFGPLARFSRMIIPHPFASWLESPSLVRSIMSLIAAIVFWALARFT